jgi:hypothetical protein
MKKQVYLHTWKSCVFQINEKIALSFRQTYPLKMGFGVILTIFFYKGEREREREREFEFTLKLVMGEPSHWGMAYFLLILRKYHGLKDYTRLKRGENGLFCVVFMHGLRYSYAYTRRKYDPSSENS